MPANEYKSVNEHIMKTAISLSQIFQRSALDAHGQFQNVNQYLTGYLNQPYEQWLGPGMCAGFSKIFLEHERDDGEKEDPAERREFAKTVSVEKLGIKGLLETQMSDYAIRIKNAAFAGNSGVSTIEDGRTHMRSLGLEYVETESFGSRFSMFDNRRLAHYIGHSPYYHMLSVSLGPGNGHAMACAAAKGRKVFLEPNAGLVICSNTAQLTAFCDAYFSNPVVKINYGKGRSVTVEVERYRKTAKIPLPIVLTPGEIRKAAEASKALKADAQKRAALP